MAASMPSGSSVSQNSTFVFKTMKQDCEDENPSPAHKSFLERLGRTVATILTELSAPTGWRLHLVLLILFIGYLVVQEIIKWNTKLLGG